MSGAYRLLNISLLIVLALMTGSYFVLPALNIEFKTFFIVLPVVIALLIGVLTFITKRQLKKGKAIGVGKIFMIRGLFLLPILALFISGLFVCKSDLITFTVLFALYYLIFAFTETKVLMKLTKINS